MKAILTWTPSTNPNLDHYAVRTSPGHTYHTADESVIREVAAGAEEVSTNQGLVAPSATALLKVYVMLTTVNGMGSNTGSVTKTG